MAKLPTFEIEISVRERTRPTVVVVAAALQIVALSADVATQMPLDMLREVEAEVEHTESFMSIVDPSGYLKLNLKLRELCPMLSAFAMFRRELERLGYGRPTGACATCRYRDWEDDHCMRGGFLRDGHDCPEWADNADA